MTGSITWKAFLINYLLNVPSLSLPQFALTQSFGVARGFVLLNDAEAFYGVCMCVYVCVHIICIVFILIIGNTIIVIVIIDICVLRMCVYR